jgi:hypothetical protein
MSRAPAAAALTFAVIVAVIFIGCGSPAGTGDGGSRDGAASDFAMTGDMTLACDKPGRCDNNAGTCCVRSIGTHESTFCDTQPCQLVHGVDTFSSPVCATAADCYDAARTDLGTLYCCPDSSLGGAGVCRFSPC